MSRVVAVTLCLTALVPLPAAQAQRRELTLLAGTTLSGATGDYLDQLSLRAGFAGGFSLRLPRTSQLSLQTELLILQRRLLGRRAESSQPPLAAGPLADAPNLWFAEIPVLLRFQRGYSTARPLRPFVIAGAYLSVRLHCQRQVTEAGGNTRSTDCAVKSGSFAGDSDASFPAVYQELDLGLVAGGGVELKRFALGARFARGFRNLVEPAGGVRTSPFDGSRLWTALFSIEYLIRVL